MLVQPAGEVDVPADDRVARQVALDDVSEGGARGDERDGERGEPLCMGVVATAPGRRSRAASGARTPRGCAMARTTLMRARQAARGLAAPRARRRRRPAAPRAESEDLFERGDRGGRTSSTVTGRPARVPRGERRVLEPAGRDPLRERRRVEVDVERVAVGRDPARDVDADRRDLARRPRQPDAGEAVDPLAGDADGAERRGSAPPPGRGRSASRRCRAGSGRGSGSRRAGPAHGRSTCRRGRSRRPRPPLRRDVQLGVAVGAPAERDDGRMLEEAGSCRGSRPARRRRRASAAAPRPPVGTRPRCIM